MVTTANDAKAKAIAIRNLEQEISNVKGLGREQNAIENVQKRLDSLQAKLQELTLIRLRSTNDIKDAKARFSSNVIPLLTPDARHFVLWVMQSTSHLSHKDLNTLRLVTKSDAQSTAIKYPDIKVESPTFESDFFGYVRKMRDLVSGWPKMGVARRLELPNKVTIEAILKLDADADGPDPKLYLNIYKSIEPQSESETEDDEETESSDANGISNSENSREREIFYMCIYENRHMRYRIEYEHMWNLLSVDRKSHTKKGVYLGSVSAAMSIFKPEVRQTINTLIRQILQWLQQRIPKRPGGKPRVLY